MPSVGEEADLPAPTGPWGRGGLEVSVFADEEKEVFEFIRGHVPSLGGPTAAALARYLCAVQHTRPTGPKKPSEVGHNMAGGNVYGLITRNKWSPRLVRHQATSLTLAGKGVEPPDAIVLGVLFTEYDPGAMIITAHAVAEKWRMLVGVNRALIDEKGNVPEMRSAFRNVVEEAAALQGKLPTAVPILAEGPAVGRQLVPHLIGTDIDFLIELTPGWSEGGLQPGRPGDPDRPAGAGTTIQGLFPPDPDDPSATCSRTVRFTGWGKDLYGAALMAGEPGDRRAYLGGVRNRNRSQRSHHHSISLRKLEQWASHWSKHRLTNPHENYGFPHFRDTRGYRFQRHFSIIAVRDAFNVFRGAA